MNIEDRAYLNDQLRNIQFMCCQEHANQEIRILRRTLMYGLGPHDGFSERIFDVLYVKGIDTHATHC